MILCVPGGPGVNAMMESDALLEFLRVQSEHARYVTSVCTGGGVTAGIDFGLVVVRELFGAAAAARLSAVMTERDH
jgi:putative intracellular protease/amidase